MQQRVLSFIEALRQAGLAPSVAESMDALHAVASVGIQRATLRHALLATLVKDEADRPTFDRVFDRFFALPGKERGKAQRPQPTGEGAGRGRGGVTSLPRPEGRPEPSPRRSGPPPEQQAPRDREHRRAIGPEPAAHEPAAHRLEASRSLGQTLFRDMHPDQLDACNLLAAELARRLRTWMSRRYRTGRRARLDVRRTLRRSISTGGVPINPAFRERRPGRPDLIALCDHSHSVVNASQFLLALLLPVQDYFRRVRLFAFVDHPVEISVEGGNLVPHQHLDLYARSDFGRVLTRFWEGYEPLLTRNAVVLILGDARNNRRPPRADVLARMRGVVQRIVWLNPEAATRWNTGDSVMRTYQRHCDDVIVAASPQELTVALKQTLRRL